MRIDRRQSLELLIRAGNAPLTGEPQPAEPRTNRGVRQGAEQLKARPSWLKRRASTQRGIRRCPSSPCTLGTFGPLMADAAPPRSSPLPATWSSSCRNARYLFPSDVSKSCPSRRLGCTSMRVCPCPRVMSRAGKLGSSACGRRRLGRKEVGTAVLLSARDARLCPVGSIHYTRRLAVASLSEGQKRRGEASMGLPATASGERTKKGQSQAVGSARQAEPPTSHRVALASAASAPRAIAVHERLCRRWGRSHSRRSSNWTA
jgi:hypothetical protein